MSFALGVPNFEVVTFSFAVLALGFVTGISLIAAVGAQNAFLLRTTLRGEIPVWPLVLVCICSEVGLLLLGVFGSGLLMNASPLVMTLITWAGVVFLVTYGSLAAVRAWRGDSALDTGRETREVEVPEIEVSEEAIAAQRVRNAAAARHSVPASSSGVAVGGSVSAGGDRLPLDDDRQRHGAGGPAAAGASRSQRPARGAMLSAILGMLAFTWLNPHAYLDSVVVLGSLANGQGPELRWSFALGCFVAGIVWFCLVGFGGKALRGVFANATAWRVLDGLIAVIMFVIAGMLLLH